MATKFDRVIIVAPTRAVCANIVATLENQASIPTTLLERECGSELRSVAQRLISHSGFGLVAGTGTGKTVSFGTIAQKVLNADSLRIAIVTREHEARNLNQANVVVMTSGIALNYLKRGIITNRDALFFDEIHETSESLEFALVLVRKMGLTASWASGTVNPTCYNDFLRSDRTIVCKNFDPAREATVIFEHGDDPTPYITANIGRFKQEQRGVVVFVPTRRQSEELAGQFRRQIPSFFYHAGTSIKELEPFLKGQVKPPFLVFMTSAGSSGLNIPNLKTVVIVDQEYRETVVDGRHVRVCDKIEVNRLLQMAGRVRGRALNAEVIMVTERQPFNFADLVPHDPDFKLGADLPHLVLACADLGYATRELDFLGTIDHDACDAVHERFQARGLIDASNRITHYGKRVLDLPLKPGWGEMVVRSTEEMYKEIADVVIMCAAAPPVYALTRGKHFDPSHVVPGSDHLTLYNVLLDVLNHVVGDADWNGETLSAKRVHDAAYNYSYEGRALYDALLSLRSICDALGVPLPNHRTLQPITQGDTRDIKFRTLLASLRSLEVVSDTRHIGNVPGSLAQFANNTIIIGETSRHEENRWGSKIIKTGVEGTSIPPNIMIQTAEKVVPIRAFHVEPGGNTMLVSTHLIFDGCKYEVCGSFDPRTLPKVLQQSARALLVEWIIERIMSPNRYTEQLAALSEQFEKAVQLSIRAGTVVPRHPIHEAGVRNIVQNVVDEKLRLDDVDVAGLEQYFPPIAPTLAERIATENPLTIELVGQTFSVHYRTIDTPPTITLDSRLAHNTAWKKLPDTIRLPSGRLVQCQVHIDSLLYGFAGNDQICTTDICSLKTQVAAHAHTLLWARTIKPTLTYRWESKKLDPVTSHVYGKHLLTGENLVRYGAVRISVVGFDNVRIETVWHASLSEAQSLHVVTENALKSDLFKIVEAKKGVEIRVERVLEKATEFLGHGSDLPEDLRKKLKKIIENGTPRQTTLLDSWLSTSERTVAAAEDAIIKEQRREKEELAEREKLLKELEPFLAHATDLKHSNDLVHKLVAVHKFVDWLIFHSGKLPGELRTIIGREVTRDYGEKDRVTSLGKHFGQTRIPATLNWQRNQDILLVQRYLAFILSLVGE